MADDTPDGNRRPDGRPDKGKQAMRKQTSSNPAYVNRAGDRMRQILYPNSIDTVESSESEQETTLPPMHTSLYHEIENNAIITKRGHSIARESSNDRTVRSVVETQQTATPAPAPHRLRHSLRRRFRLQPAAHTGSTDSRPTRTLPTTHTRLMARFPIFANESEDHAVGDSSPGPSPDAAAQNTPVRSAAATTQVASTSTLQLPSDRLACVDSASTLIPRDTQHPDDGQEPLQRQVERTEAQRSRIQERPIKSERAVKETAVKIVDASAGPELPGTCLFFRNQIIY